MAPVAAVDSGDLDLNDTTVMDFVASFQLCINDKHEISKILQIKDLQYFNRTERGV